MNDQDCDLIIALAQGHLSTAAAEDASARIEADPELASAYAEQVLALDFLSSAEVPQMTVAERSELHTNLTQQLGLIEQAAPKAVPPKRKAAWWAPVFGLVTAAAVVAAIVILPGSSDESLDQAGTNLDDDSGIVSQTSSAAGAAESAPDTVGEQDSLDTVAFSVYETDSIELEELLEETSGAQTPAAVERKLSDFSFKSTVDLDRDQVESCLNELATELPDGIIDILVIGADVEDEATIVHLGFDYGSGVEDGLSFVLGDCSLVAHSSQG
jgi:hypothetical protein